MRLWERICGDLQGFAQDFVRTFMRIHEIFGEDSWGFMRICKTLGEDLHEDL